MNAHVKVVSVKSGGRVMLLEQLKMPARDASRGIVPIDELVADLVVLVPKAAGMNVDDVIELFRDGIALGVFVQITQAELDDPNFTEFTLYYPESEFPAAGQDTTIRLDYSVYDPSAQDGLPTGLELLVRFDRRPPAGIRPGPISFTQAQLAGITEGDIVDDVLPVSVNPYLYAEAEDEISMWLGTDDNEASGSYLTPSFTVTVPDQPTAVSFSRQALEDIGDGQRWFGYRVKDWAGNISVISSRTAITVFLDVPTLLAPLVPEADDGLITYNDANPDVTVQIPAYPGAAVGDLITVSWGSVALPPYRLTNADLVNDPLVEILVPYATVKQVGDGSVAVSYAMDRTGQPTVDSAVTDVNVNLVTPGGPDPDPNPELPEHGNIKAPSLQVGISPVNTITPDDFASSRPGQVTILRGGVDNNAIWLVDDIIQVYLNETIDDVPALAPVTVNPTNQPGDIIVPVPFTGVIENLPSGQVEMFFTLTRMLPAIPAPVPVTVRSPVQIVNVAAGNDLPGGGTTLDQALWPEVDAVNPPTNILSRPMGIDGTTFRINLAGVTNIELAKEPKVSYDLVGIVASAPPFTRPPTPATPPAPPFTTIEASRIREIDIPLTQTHLTQGYFEVPLSYAQLYPICRNGAILDYSLKNNLGETKAAQRYIFMALNQGGTTCSLP